MYTVQELAKETFGLQRNRRYKIIHVTNGKVKKVSSGIYLGAGGECKVFLMFRLFPHGIVECYLKADVIAGEYRFVEVKELFKQNKKGAVMYG